MHIADYQPDSVSRRIAPVREVAEQVDLEPEHTIHVCALARVLFLETQPLHGLGDEERALLEAAALLHDVGLREDGSRHHKRSRDWILANGVPGFDQREQRMIACIARYHRKGHPKATHAVFKDLPREERSLVRMLAGLLRIADGLDRTHVAATRGIRVEKEGAMLRLYAAQEHISETDVWGGMRKRFLLQDALGVSIEIMPEILSGAMRPHRG